MSSNLRFRKDDLADLLVREHNMIRFKNGKPTGIYFSQHTSGDACDWEDAACFSKQGDRVSDCFRAYTIEG